MKYRKIQSINIPIIGLGTSGIGGGWMFKDTSDDREAIEAIQYAIGLGMTHIDTAEAYANGHAEELVGAAIKDFDRAKLFVTTKVHPSHLDKNDLSKACQNSLQRLNTDYVDLYLIHWPNADMPIPKTMPVMDELVKKGLTRFIGVSNFDVDLLKQAQQYSENKIFTNQVEYSLLERAPEQQLLPYCQTQDMILTAYSPLGKGQLKFRINPLLDQLAQKYDKTPAQIALNYLISHDNVIVIPKAVRKEHLMENATAADFNLALADIELIKQAF